MTARKPSLKFSENKGTPTSGMAASRQKLLTDADKAKSRREQLRFGKKETSTQVNSSARKQVSGKGVVHDDCMNAPARTIFLALKFLSIENYFKKHSGAQTDSEPFFLHG